MKDLPRRALTAAIFATAMLGGLLWSRISFSVLLMIIQTGCLFEYLLLIRKFQNYKEDKDKIAFIVTIILASIPLLIVTIIQSKILSLLYAASVLPVCVILIANEYIYQSPTPFRNGLLNAASALYISVPLICLYSLADDPTLLFEVLVTPSSWFPYLVAIPFGIVLLIWTNDTFAYFAGVLFGKHKILPSVSPKKSWEGFFGGFVFALITAWLLNKYSTALHLSQWLTVAIIVSVFGTIGDFFESMIKRRAGVKDSGNILPGHGGFLDRFDALLFCVPFVTVYLALAS